MEKGCSPHNGRVQRHDELYKRMPGVEKMVRENSLSSITLLLKHCLIMPFMSCSSGPVHISWQEAAAAAAGEGYYLHASASGLPGNRSVATVLKNAGLDEPLLLPSRNGVVGFLHSHVITEVESLGSQSALEEDVKPLQLLGFHLPTPAVQAHLNDCTAATP